MDIETVVQRCMRSRYLHRAIQAAGLQTVEALLREELEKRAEAYDKRPTEAMSAAMVATLRRAKAAAGNGA